MNVPANDFTFELEENAEDSLTHGVEHFVAARDTLDPSDLKQTVLLTFHAVELFLKARLVKAHPILVFQKPEDAKKEDPKTVDFETLIGRLRSIGVDLDSDNLEDLKRLKKIRNSIEHHRIVFTTQSAEDYVGRAMRFLERFLEKELGVILEDMLDEATYEALSQAVHSYEERVEKAQERAKAELPLGNDSIGEWDLIQCPDCGEETVAAGSYKEGNVHCHLCKRDFWAEACQRCGEPIVGDGKPSKEDWSAICDGCIENMIDRD